MGRCSNARERLVEVAFDLIGRQTYGSVSVDQICERADVCKGSFYHFFPSKVDLALAAFDHAWAQKKAWLDSVFSAQTSPLERVERYCDSIYEVQKEAFSTQGSVPGCPFATVGSEVCALDDRLRVKAQEMVDRNLRYFEAALAEAGVADVRGTARMVQAVVWGLLLQAKIANDPEILRDLSRRALSVMKENAAAA